MRNGGGRHGARDESARPSGGAAGGGGLAARPHEIVQAETSELAAWLHGIVHTLEGDLDNARYWYRKASREFPGPENVHDEIAAAARRVSAGT